MRRIRYKTLGTVVTLAFGMLASSGTATMPAWAQSDDIEVTYLMHPNGDPLYAASRINYRGQVLANASLVFPGPQLTGTVVWHNGEVTPVADRDGHITVNDFSEAGHVLGVTEPGWPEDTTIHEPFLWVDGEWTDLPFDGYFDPFGMAVNDHGKVAAVVELLDADGERYQTPVAWQDGELYTPAPEVLLSGASVADINNRSQVALDIWVDGNQRAALWEVGGEFIELGTLGGPTSRVVAINGQGMVLGNSTTADGEERAFLWYEGEMTDIGSLGGGASQATALNEWGQVVGTSTNAASEQHGFQWYQGTMTRIEPPFDCDFRCQIIPTSRPIDINNWGQVIGTVPPGMPSGSHPFLWQNGRIADLTEGTDMSSGSNAYGINDRVQIVGVDDQGLFGGSQAVIWDVPPLWGYQEGVSDA